MGIWCLGDNRANVEVVYVAIAALSIIGIGAVGIAIGSGITDSTASQAEDIEFELIDAAEYEIVYTSDETLTDQDIERILVVGDGGSGDVSGEVYADGELVLDESTRPRYEQDSRTLEDGDLVYDKTLRDSEGVGLDIEYGDTISFVIETPDGDTYTADEVSLPARQSIEGRITRNGSVAVEEEPDINEETTDIITALEME